MHLLYSDEAWAGIERFLLGLYEENEGSRATMWHVVMAFSAEAFIAKQTFSKECQHVRWRNRPLKMAGALVQAARMQLDGWHWMAMPEELTIMLKYGRAGRWVNGIRRSLSATESWKVMESHGKSWKVMESHGSIQFGETWWNHPFSGAANKDFQRVLAWARSLCGGFRTVVPSAFGYRALRSRTFQHSLRPEAKSWECQAQQREEPEGIRLLKHQSGWSCSGFEVRQADLRLQISCTC